ncbi:helix-turn-helix domain-containing protein [Zooshikella ganghwensis]|uniref:helix-turn-helix domain-containing protein n=1 Tax=Zooshikella ganghwensis TaxID=202772 RepID=UPI001E30B2C1|nr:transcriptional regulator [Zooshikella ganghwensis]
MDKSILEVVHKGAKDLHNVGLMDEITLREFDALCLPPIKTYSASQIKKIRHKCKASQAVFAAYLNTSPSTI